MKKTLTAAAILLAATLTACGGGSTESSAPTDASVEDFCKPFTDLASGDPAAADVRALGEGLEAAGTPEDISEEQRAGFAVFVNALKDVDEGTTFEEVSAGNMGDVSEDDAAKAAVFVEYLTTTCMAQMTEGLPTDLPTDLPTE